MTSSATSSRNPSTPEPLALLHAVPPEIVHHLLQLAPDSGLGFEGSIENAQRDRRRISEMQQGEIVRALSRLNVHPLLERCIHNSWVSHTIRTGQAPGCNALSFHVSVRREILALGVPRDNFPGTILSPEGVSRCSSQVQVAQDSSLVKIWGRLRGRITLVNGVPAGLPAENASAQEIRTWMQEGANLPLLRRITFLNLSRLQLTCVPEEIGLCTGLLALDLSNNHLVSLPEGVFRGLAALQRLYLEGNHLASLPEGVFRGLAALQELYLFSNHLGSLPEGVFRGLVALQILHLYSNHLVSLPEGVFRGLAALQILHLYSNHLGSLPEGVFRGLAALEWLSLEGNHLVSLPEGVFRGLAALQILHLYSNHLVSLPEGVFRGLVALQRLSLEGNHLVSLPEGVFRGLAALEWLFLEGNHLVSLPEGVFRGLVALQELYLSNNHLVSLPEGVFRGVAALQRLCLYGNPQLLFFYKDLPATNNRECLGMMQEFFNYTCISRLAAFYKLAAGNGPLEAVQASFSSLPVAIKNALYSRVWEEAGRPAGGPEWGAHHTFEEMPRFQRALKRHVTEAFNALGPNQKNGVYGHVYHLARAQGVFVDPRIPNWGEVHAFGNILRLIDAMQQQEQTNQSP